MVCTFVWMCGFFHESTVTLRFMSMLQKFTPFCYTVPPDCVGVDPVPPSSFANLGCYQRASVNIGVQLFLNLFLLGSVCFIWNGQDLCLPFKETA